MQTLLMFVHFWFWNPEQQGRVRNGLFNQRPCGAWGTGWKNGGRGGRQPRTRCRGREEQPGQVAGPAASLGPHGINGPWARPGRPGPLQILSDLSLWCYFVWLAVLRRLSTISNKSSRENKNCMLIIKRLLYMIREL